MKEIDDVSDGFHTFRQLYYQRMMLFATIVKQNKDKAWKSLRHEDGELCFGGGWFIVGIDTPEGSYTYHYEDDFYSLFDCIELERGKHWDGHTEKDVTRLLSLEKEPVIDKIRAEIKEESRFCPLTEGLERALEIIDKYKAESEDEDAIKVIEKNLCDSCTNIGCMFQSGIVRIHCDFYK